MDAFFAAVEQRDNPEYRGKPVVIGADPRSGAGRGVVSTCSYEARKYGIHSAQPISIAYRKCPTAVFLPVNMKKYVSISHQIDMILEEFSPKIEKVSIDESFLDITGSYHLFGTPVKACMRLKERIKEEAGLSASVGLAPNKFIAKIASDLDKPDGFIEVQEDGILDFLWPLDVSRIWGVGKKTLMALNREGIVTIGDIAKKDLNEMVDLFGKAGEHFWMLSNGIDDREVEPDHEVKSVSNEYTFDKNTVDEMQILTILQKLSEKVSGRLRKENLKGKTITLKIRLEDFNTFTRAISIKQPTNYGSVIFDKIKEKYYVFNRGRRAVRLLGVKVSNFSEAQMGLFDDSDNKKREKIHDAVDKIKEKFGDDVIRGTGK
jgi:nucleotidyltransferase/DNA polymerase involved in DNA repair